MEETTRRALSGRTAIVTGADRCFGAAASHALSRAGAGVVLAARDSRAIEALAASINSTGGYAVAVPTDVTNPMSVRRLVEQTLGAFGRLDAAFNDAQAPGVSVAMKYQIPAMRRADGGRIVNLAPACDPYDAVIELTRKAALDVADSGVRINALAADPHGSAKDVADAVVWLCSSGPSLASGETLHVVDAFLQTRVSLHGVAELLLAGPQWRRSKDIRLRSSSGGFATVTAPGLAVAGGLLVTEDGSTIGPLHGSTYDELAGAASVTAGVPEGVYGEGSGVASTDRIFLDSAAAGRIATAFADGDAALRVLAPTETPVLWPEHFDIAITLDEVNYGVSPGDQDIPEPYAYVGPWKRLDGDFWNMPFGAARPLSALDGPEEILAFLTEGQQRAS